MQPAKVVVHYLNGQMVKGFTKDFFPNKASFHLEPAESPAAPELLEIVTSDLKAVFFVRDFSGDPTREERKQLLEGEHPSGRMMEVTLVDGEVFVGSVLSYDVHRPGFFLFPVDPKSNNLRVFIIFRAVSRLVNF